MTKRIEIFWDTEFLSVYVNGVFLKAVPEDDFLAGDPNPEMEKIAGTGWRDLVTTGSHHLKHKDVTAALVKKFRGYPDKVIYRGTLKGCKKRIPPSKKDQFEIRLNGES